jgi:hypothetical protein
VHAAAVNKQGFVLMTSSFRTPQGKRGRDAMIFKKMAINVDNLHI